MILTWTPNAHARFIQAIDWLAERNPQAAAQMADRVLDRIDLLLDHPRMGRVGGADGSRELVVSGTPYIVSYEVWDDRIVIVGFYHHSQKWPKSP